MLLVFSGLPGTGKSTIAKRLASELSATYVRVDEIESTLAQGTSLGHDVGPAGYLVAFAIARSNLICGNTVIADSVNPVPDSRQGWRSVAEAAGTSVLEIEVICSNEDEHRRRVMGRTPDVPGLALPTWEMVKARHYVPWTTDRLVIDTALLGPDEASTQILRHLDAIPRNPMAKMPGPT